MLDRKKALEDLLVESIVEKTSPEALKVFDLKDVKKIAEFLGIDGEIDCEAVTERVKNWKDGEGKTVGKGTVSEKVLKEMNKYRHLSVMDNETAVLMKRILN